MAVWTKGGALRVQSIPWQSHEAQGNARLWPECDSVADRRLLEGRTLLLKQPFLGPSRGALGWRLDTPFATSRSGRMSGVHPFGIGF